jgi:uncharacterized phage infection (PIP) family protein YhgE
MSKNRHSQLAELVSNLKQQKDQLELKLHLGQKEAKEQWAQLESKLKRLQSDFEPVSNVASETTENVFSALELAAGELKKGYDRLSEAIENKKQ